MKRSIKREDIISLSVLLLFSVLALVYSLIYPAYWPYELTAVITLIVFSALFRFAPRLLKDTAPRSFKSKRLTNWSASLSSREAKASLFFKSIGVLLVLLFLVRFESGADYLMAVSQLTSSFLSRSAVAFSSILVPLWSAALFFVVLAQFLKTDALLAIEKWVGGFVFLLIGFTLPFEIAGVCGDVSSSGFAYRGISDGDRVWHYRRFARPGLGAESKTQAFSERSLRGCGRGHRDAFYFDLGLHPDESFRQPNRQRFRPERLFVLHRILIGLCFLLPIAYFLLLYPFDQAHRRVFLGFHRLQYLDFLYVLARQQRSSLS
jgi:hypothetical protein